MACSEHETAASTGQGGAFTNAVLKALSKGKKSASYVMKNAAIECKGEQTPKYLASGVKKTLIIY